MVKRSREPKDLSLFASNQYSQFGEDGILAEIISRIGEGARRCIEFGAWDGFHFSNTAALWTRGWEAVLIEADQSRFEDLVKATSAAPQCLPVCARVGWRRGIDTLEDILFSLKVPTACDVLSIDIDGDDIRVLESLQNIFPRIVLCEFNPTIPYYFDIENGNGAFVGSSLGSVVRVASEKGLTLVAVTDVNAIFVANSELDKLGDVETRISLLAKTRYYNHVITSYDGVPLVIGEFPYGLQTAKSLGVDAVRVNATGHAKIRQSILN
jgi:hypothetical protein